MKSGRVITSLTSLGVFVILAAATVTAYLVFVQPAASQTENGAPTCYISQSGNTLTAACGSVGCKTSGPQTVTGPGTYVFYVWDIVGTEGSCAITEYTHYTSTWTAWSCGAWNTTTHSRSCSRSLTPYYNSTSPSETSTVENITETDTVAPATPASPAVTPTNAETFGPVIISWAPGVTDTGGSGVAGYQFTYTMPSGQVGGSYRPAGQGYDGLTGPGLPATGQLYVTAQAPAAPGTWTYFINAYDAAGNISATSAVTSITIFDSPVISISPGPGTYSQTSLPVTVTYSDKDGVAYMLYCINPSSPCDPYNNPTPYTTYPNGTTITLTSSGYLCPRGVDTGNVWSANNCYYYTLGQVAPPAISRSPAPGVYYQNSLPVTVTYSDADGVTYTRHCLDVGACEPGTSNSSTFTNGAAITVIPLYDLYVSQFLCTRARDGAGSWSATDCAGYTRHMANPSSVQVFKPTAGVDTTLRVQWTDNSNEEEDGYYIYQSYNGGGDAYVGACSPAGCTDVAGTGTRYMDFTVSGCGTYSYGVLALNKSTGNNSQKIYTPTINAGVCDTTPPAISSFTANKTFTNGPVTFNWAATDVGSGINHFELYRAPYDGSTIAYNDTGTADGTSYGFWKQLASRIIPNALAALGNCTDSNKSGCVWAMVGSNISAGATSVADNPVADGIYYYGLHAVDNVGLVGTEPAVLKVIKDTAAPSAPGTPYISGGANPSKTGTFTLSWPAATDSSGIGYYSVNRGFSGFGWDFVGTTASTSWPEINYPEVSGISYLIYAVDSAGNMGQLAQSPNITVDKTAPTVTVNTFGPINNGNKSAVTLNGSCESGLTVSLWLRDEGNDKVDTTTTCSASSWSATVNASSLVDGPVTTAASQIDAAGNTGSGNKTATKDTVAPIVSAFTSSVTATNSQVTFNWTATDSGGSGLNRYELYRAPYNAGNITMKTSPHGWFNWFSSRLLPGALAIVNTTCTDTDKRGCAWIQIATATSPYTDTISSLSDGAYYYGLHAVDNAGNVGTEPLILKVVLDATAPGAAGGEAITVKVDTNPAKPTLGVWEDNVNTVPTATKLTKGTFYSKTQLFTNDNSPTFTVSCGGNCTVASCASLVGADKNGNSQIGYSNIFGPGSTCSVNSGVVAITMPPSIDNNSNNRSIYMSNFTDIAGNKGSAITQLILKIQNLSPKIL